MRIVVVGSGYVGLVSGACFAQMGNRVVCVDTNAQKIERLNRGEIPIFEPGLETMVKECAALGDLRFSTDLGAALDNAEIAFIAVGTPTGEDGGADLRSVLAVASEIGRVMTGPLVVVDKSTVPVGTADRVRNAIRSALDERIAAGEKAAESLTFDVVSNPEFLKEGNALADFMRPDRVVIGADSPEACALMTALYEPFVKREQTLLTMDVRSAEMTKYAANAMLATRISFMNEIARLCERVGADVGKVRLGIGSDSRIGTAFLFPGCGYGGSCFPKDIRALIRTMNENELDAPLLSAVEEVNRRQKKVIAEKVIARFGENLTGRTFALWGLAFKPNTDDMREAPSIDTIKILVKRGARIQAFDPEATVQAREVYLRDFEASIDYAANKYDALNGASALLLLTEWTAFRCPDFDEIKSRLAEPVIFDGRNQYVSLDLTARGFDYHAIGRPAGSAPFLRMGPL